MSQFIILLYKDFILRKRHYIITSCELIIPILFACIPLVLLSAFNEDPGCSFLNTTFDTYYYLLNDTDWPQLNSHRYDIEDLFEVPLKFSEENVTIYLYYTPANRWTYDLMSDAIERFRIKADFNENIQLQKFDNESELEAVFLMHSSKSAKIIGTIFNNVGKELPDSLNYTIRCGDLMYVNTFKTDEVLKYQERFDNPYKETLFLGWQAALEQTFIRTKADNGVNESYDFTVFLQSFPGKGERYRSVLALLFDLWPLIFSVGFLLFAAILTYRITSEKANGMLILMRTMGLSQFTYWISTFTNYFLPSIIMSFIITMIYKTPPLDKMYVFRKTEFSVLWLLILVFITNLILFCFIITIFFNNPRYSVIFLLMSYLLTFTLLFFYYFYGAYYTAYLSLSYASKLFLCIVPMSSVFYSFQLLFFLETRGSGITWNMTRDLGPSSYFDLSFIINGNIISFITLIVLLWYLDAVWPFQDRISQPVYFPFMMNYWFSSWFSVRSFPDEGLNLDSECYEPDSNASHLGIVIQNLTKWYDSIWSSKPVINNLSFEIRFGKITVLLGPQKSGKTTLFKMLSGSSKPNHGKIFINGWDLSSSLSRVKKCLGVCQQNSVLYETLTVHEHLQIFAGLKGVQLHEINAQAFAIEQLLLLSAYKDDLSVELSKECKRKLNLGLAVVGSSQVLLLDEPTRYMSSESRYHFWSVLHTLKANCTIFLSSSSVDDICNCVDRIALFSYGQIVACGSLHFLKEKLGVSYKLHITKDIPFDMDEILRVIRKYYSDASLERETKDLVIINFKSDLNMRLGSMTEELENVVKEIGIKSFGIVMVPMEDVFMDESYIAFLENRNAELQSTPHQYSDNKDVCTLQRYLNRSWSLHFSRLHGLFYKRAYYMYRLWGLFALNMLIPLILICLCFILLKGYHFSKYPSLHLNLNAVYDQDTFGFIETYSNNTFPKSVIQDQLLSVMEANLVSVYPSYNVVTLSELYGYTHYPDYSLGFLVGGSVTQDEPNPYFVAWYNSHHHHTSSIALNLIHTAILRHYFENGTICLTNHPLPYNYITAIDYENDSQNIVILAFIPLVSAFIGASYIFIPVYERSSKAKLMQLMSGLSVRLYWLSMFLWDILIHTGECGFLILAAYIFQPYYFGDTVSFGAIYFIFLVFGWCAIPISYVMSLVFSRPTVAFVYLFVFYVITGLIRVLFYVAKIHPAHYVAWIFHIFPTYSISEGFRKIFMISAHNSLCHGLADNILDIICDVNNTLARSSPIFKCCHDLCKEEECDDYQEFITFSLEVGILREILIMFVVGSLLLLFLKLLEAARYQSYKGCILVKPIIEDRYRKDVMFSDIITEKERIEDAVASGNHGDTLMVLDLTKCYGNLCTVNKLTFGVNIGESLVIIGGRGAGKSTLFKMIAGETVPTAGNSFIKDSNLVNNLKQFQAHVGYCPQYSAFLNHLTGEEMLRFMSKLRGVIEELEPALLEMIELGSHANKPIKYYNFVNKRKLAVAMAVIGLPPVLIFDEPTTGINFKSKKIIWNLLNKIKSCNCSAIIVSSKSIFECRELCKIGFCTKLAVLDNGNFQCLGPIEELEKKYNSGKIVKILLNLENLDLTGCFFEVKGYFESSVPKATLLTYREGTFTYHVGESFLTLSSLFHLMDYMKMKFNLHKYFINNSSFNKICHCYTEQMREKQC